MSISVPPWSGKRVSEARALMAQRLPAACHQCGGLVSASDSWVVEHIKSRAAHPELTWVVSNWSVSHRKCSDATGQAAVIEKAKRDALRDAGFSRADEAGEAPPLSFSPSPARNPVEIRPDLSWSEHVRTAPTWLNPVLAAPRDSSPPVAATPVHPDAVGTYGPEACEWIETTLSLSLRWWQRYAIWRQLEHRADGSLCWTTVVESCPRRAGKSVRLRGMAMWRIASATRIGETQEVIHCGRDLPIVREVMRPGWRVAESVLGWKPTTANGKEQIEVLEDGSRWLARTIQSAYGYSPGLACVDEAWDIKAADVAEALEPALMDRIWPQLHLTSTSHRRATSLMRDRIASALAADDGATLLLWWGALPTADFSDPEVWRSASPFWSDERAELMQRKYDAATAKAPDLDDPDPVRSFAHQYLNAWEFTEKAAAEKGTPLTTPDEWAELRTIPATPTPDACAVESWFSEGVSVACAYADGNRVTVQTTDHPDLATAAAAVRATGYTGTVIVGASLLTDPAFKGLRTKPGQGRTSQAVATLARLLSEDALRHTGEAHLSEQVLAVRTLPGADGPRLASKGRADAIKAATWAADAARTVKKYGGVRTVLTAS